MKKSRVLWLSSIFSLSFLIPCFAEQVQGLVESVDSSNHSIVVKDPVSGSGRSVRVHPKVISEVKKGSVVKATLKSGSDDADTVEVLEAR